MSYRCYSMQVIWLCYRMTSGTTLLHKFWTNSKCRSKGVLTFQRLVRSTCDIKCGSQDPFIIKSYWLHLWLPQLTAISLAWRFHSEGWVCTTTALLFVRGSAPSVGVRSNRLLANTVNQQLHTKSDCSLMMSNLMSSCYKSVLPTLTTLAPSRRCQ